MEDILSIELTKNKIVLINPNLVVQRNDRFTTGVVYMPIGLASIAASVLKDGIFKCQVIDAFGESPRQVKREGDFCWHGITVDEIISRVPADSIACYVYANQLINHAPLCKIIKKIKKTFPTIKIVVLENTQAVTAYALRPISAELYSEGADFILCGEGEDRVLRCTKALLENDLDELKKIDGLCWDAHDHPPTTFIDDLDSLAFPAWELFPIENYWGLRFAHGPQSSQKYLPLLTSRGCPYPCNFCVVPETNDKKWRSRSALSVVNELQYMVNRFGVKEFHWEDLNPTIQDKRIREICIEIVSRKLKIIWKIVAGTKVESIKDVETLRLMGQSGCRYISISPESGSKRMLKLIEKPFKTEHAINLIREMNKINIRSQACFVLGFPGETHDDRLMTQKMVKTLIKNGLDEIALFIISPVPGSIIFSKFKGYKSLSELNFTPKWRSDYKELNKFRVDLYFKFLVWKTIYFPGKIIRQIINFLTRNFETKMEMVPYKAIVYYFLDMKELLINKLR